MNKFIFALCIGISLISAQTIFSQNQIINKDTFVVARDGTGDFRNIQDVLYAIRAFRPEHTTVFIKSGTYKEKLILPTWVNDVTFIGEDQERTIITWDDHANINDMGTFRTYTFLIQGNGITFENLTIENAAAPLGQAVAAHIEGDRIIFRNCRFLGNQDTIYTGRENSRHYFENCYIEGTTDFIFGPSICWFEKCTLYCKIDSYITAASTPQKQTYGYIFNKCRVVLADHVTKIYLGRPWRAHAMTLFMHCELPENIAPQGWHNWNNEENELTVRYMEYHNTGAGASVTQRVKWSQQLTEKEASDYTIKNVMQGSDGWSPYAQ